MKRIVEVEEPSGLESLLGEEVILLCANYFYAGTLSGVNKTCVELTNAKLVYETGPWITKNYTDAQVLPGKVWRVQLAFIESFGIGK